MQNILPTPTIPAEKSTPTAQTVAPLMHWWFLVDIVLVFIAGVQLYVLSELTGTFFAWTIQVPLTAAFLGAAYWASIPMLYNSFRERTWANARLAVSGVWLFTTLTLILTIQYWGKFNWASPLFTAQFAFWAWLVIYVAVPVGLALTWLLQRRIPGGDPARTRPLPTWFRAVMGVQAVILLIVGIALYVAPAAMIPLWVWTLTPLTAGAVGAWCIGLAITTGQSVWENDWQRIGGGIIAYALFGLLQLIAVAHYAGQMDWTRASAWLYVVFIASVLVVGGVGTWKWRSGQA